MSEPAKSSWTETDLKLLLGQSESIRREFKSGRMFEGKQDGNWVRQLSTEVSALANTEGGELFLGIEEDKKSKPRVATGIDEVPVAVAPERLQQLIEGNVSPYLPGIRVNRVRLSKQLDKVVFVIQVPQGHTAYQANDGRYYGRSEFEAKYLPDHEVRLRMSRGKVARGVVRVRLLEFALGVEEERRVRAQKAKEIQSKDLEVVSQNPLKITEVGLLPALEVLSAQTIPDKITFDFVFRNDGEVTIRAPAVEFYENRARGFDQGELAASLRTRVNMDKEIIYPGDERTIDGSSGWLQCKRDVLVSEGDYSVRWKIFLDNSPPSSGEIDLGAFIKEGRRKNVGGR